MGEVYQVLRVKPDDLETALNDMSRAGWSLHSLAPAASTMFGLALFVLGRGHMQTLEYHVVFRRAAGIRDPEATVK